MISNNEDKRLPKTRKNSSFYQKNILWKTDVERSKQEIQIEKEKKLYSECFFEPNVQLNRPERKNNKSLSNDYFYKKNINWLNKNKDLKHQLEIDIEERKNQYDKPEKIYKKLEKLRKIKSEKENVIEINPNDALQRQLQTASSDLKSIDKEFSIIKNMVTSLKETLNENIKIKTILNN